MPAAGFEIGGEDRPPYNSWTAGDKLDRRLAQALPQFRREV
jgi:hypothetical protein